MIASIFYISDRVQYYFQYNSRPNYGPIVGKRLNDAKKDSLITQDIYTSIPRRIGKTNYSYVEIISKDLEKAIRISAFSDDERGISEMRAISESEERSWLSPGVTNIAFVNDNGKDTRLLIDNKCSIIRADIPLYGDTLQKYIIYRIVFSDSDGDGRLTYHDESNLFISDLNGLKLRQICPDSISVSQLIKSFRRNKIIFRGLYKPKDISIPKNDWRDQIFTYDLQKDTLELLLPNKTVLDLARRLLVN
jgi:hypothetical protein